VRRKRKGREREEEEERERYEGGWVVKNHASSP
jgi:hypothetical protein